MSGKRSGCSRCSRDKSTSSRGHRRWCGFGLSTARMSRRVAPRNQGKVLNGTNHSRSSTTRQKPRGPTLLTTAAEMLFPRCADFILMFPDDPEGRRDLPLVESVILRQSDLWHQPDLRVPVPQLNVYMRAHLLAREKIEPITPHPENCRAHDGPLTPPDGRAHGIAGPRRCGRSGPCRWRRGRRWCGRRGGRG